MIIGLISNILNIFRIIQKFFVREKDIKLVNCLQIVNLSLLNKYILRLKFPKQNNIKQLQANNIKLEILFYSIADGVILLDSDLRILLANPIAITSLGWLNKSIIGTYICNLLPQHINDQLLPILSDLLTKSSCDHFTQEIPELYVNIRSKKTKNLKFLFTKVCRKKYNSLQSITITIQDISQNIELNAKKNQLISTLSHEVYTPLSNIRSFLETLYEYYDSLNKQKKLEFLKIANRETIRLTHLVKNMLDLSYLESQHNYTKDKIDICSTINYIICSYQIIANQKQIQMILESSTFLPPIIGNHNLLVQVISNIVGNALKFTHKNSYIIIRVYDVVEKVENSAFFRRNSHFHKVRIEVIDEGIGISKTLQRQIFQPYSQANNSFSVLKGKGLGLAISQTIINRHNSFINIYSETQIGSCFWFDLPIITIKDF